MSSNRRATLQMLGALALMRPGLSMAQTQAPTPATTRLLVGFPPGATGDRIARAVSPLLAAQLQNSVIVDNKPGAGGQLAIEYAKSAHADGSVLLQTIGSSMVIYPHTYRSLRYDPLRDFIPLGTAATAPIAFVSAARLSLKSVGDAVSLIRQDKSVAFYGSPASGSVFHFSGVLMGRAMGSDFTHVPYKGSAPALADVLSGQMPFAFLAPSDILEHHRAGKLRILAVTGTTRASQLPDVPTFPEAGFKDLVNREWFSYFLSKGTPPELVARYGAALRKVVADPDLRSALLAAGLEIGDGDAATLAATMQSEFGQWRQVVKEIGFIAD